MLIASKEKSVATPVFSKRLDIQSVIYSPANPSEISREGQMLIFLKEALLGAQRANHVENFIQNLFLHCPDIWAVSGFFLRQLNVESNLVSVIQVSNTEVRQPKEIKISHNTKIPSVEAIRTNVIIFFENRQSVQNYSSFGQEICKDNQDFNSLICMPITVGNEVWGSLEIFFEKEIECDDGIKDFFSCVALIVGTAIGNTLKNETAPLRDLDDHPDDEELIEKLKMNSKLMKIAIMISHGMTNTEIARKLSYSESATRYETVKLYAMLRAKNRAEAGAVINRLHLKG
jgi:transcriptional regulator with GAF, ATPase, and Fis domain